MHLIAPNDVQEVGGILTMPWGACYSRSWELKQYGIGAGHKDGIHGQFPEIDFSIELDSVMEQIWAGHLGFVEHPKPGFFVEKKLRRL